MGLYRGQSQMPTVSRKRSLFVFFCAFKRVVENLCLLGLRQEFFLYSSGPIERQQFYRKGPVLFKNLRLKYSKNIRTIFRS